MKPIKFYISSVLALVLIASTGLAQNPSDCLPTPLSYRIYLSPLITNLTSNQFKSEEKSGLGFNAGGDFIYTFYTADKLSLNTSLGLAISSYHSQRKGNFTNILQTTDIDNESVLLTEKTTNQVEKQHMLFLDIPVKLGINYSVTPTLAAYANIGLAYGIELNATYNSTASLTRTGYYATYNVLLYDIDIQGSPYYYPTNKAVSGNGSINARNNLSAEFALGMKCKVNSQWSLFAGAKLMHGFGNVKTNPSTLILAEESGLHTLMNRNDKIQTRALGLELGIQFNISKCPKQKQKQRDTASGTVNDKAKFHAKAFDAVTAEAANATMVIKNNGNLIKTMQADKNGQFSLELPKGKVYDIEVTAPGYDPKKQTVDLTTKENNIQKDFALVPEINGVLLTARMLDAKTSAPVRGTVVILSNGRKIKSVTADKAGNIKLDVPEGAIYDVEALAPNYVPQLQTIDLTTVAKGTKQEIAFDPIVKIEKGVELKFNTIYFSNAANTLTTQSEEILNMLSEVLKDHPQMKVEISGHADNVGYASSNLVLSQRRAQVVMNYLLGKGIKGEQLTVSGFGDTKPAATNDTREGRSKNRRVELTGIDF
jgi:outer membrane protein OmpA-like peptidoglycan-associated protein